MCATGIHACSVADLPWWLDAELWKIELDGPVERSARKLVAPRGRLTHRIDTWDDDAMTVFATACRARIEERAAASPELADYVDDTPRSRPATAAFIAVRVAELDGGAAAYASEREWQARWLADRLGLG